MPTPVRACLFAAALLAAVLISTLARAELTGADKEGIRAFASCLDKTGGDEAECINILGRYAWYPRDVAICEAVAARVGETLAARTDVEDQAGPEPRLLGEKLDMRDLFFNERCARLGLPHDSEAAKKPDTLGLRQEYDACLTKADASRYSCNEQLGVHRYYPANNKDCKFNLSNLTLDAELGLRPRWKLLFENERCHRLALNFAKLSEVIPVIGATPADLEGIRVFAACLDESASNEEFCIERLGRHAWYPRDSSTCEAIALRVENIIGASGDPVWRDMFQNERCARLGLAYSAFAIFERKPDTQSPRTVDCRDERNRTHCNEIYGRHEWNEEGKRSICEFHASTPIKFPGSTLTKWWDYWFKNERCRRLGRGYFDAMAGVQHSGATVELVQ